MFSFLKEKEENASTAKIALWYMFASIFAKGVSSITTPIFTRLLTREEFGIVSNFTSWESIFLVIVTLDFSASIMRAKYDFNNRIDEYMSSILLFSNLTTIFVYLIIELNQQYFTEIMAMDISLIRMMFLYILFLPAFNYLQIKHRIYKKYKFFVAFTIVSVLLQTFTSLLLVMNLENKCLGRIYGIIIPAVCLNIILWISIIQKGKKISYECVKYASTISIPLIPHALSGILLGNSDRVMIMKFCGAEDTAMYSLAYSISLLASLIWTSMNHAWSPWLFDNIHANHREIIIKNSKIYLSTFIILVIIIFLTAPEIIYFFGGEKYLQAKYVMPPVILGCVFQFMYAMYVNIEIYSKKTISISIGTLFAATINITLNLLFIPRYGYIAAAYTTMVGYACLLLFHYFIVKRKIFELLSIYNNKFILNVALFMTGFSILSLWLYDHTILRYCMISLYFIFISLLIYKNKALIVNLFAIKSIGKKI